MQVQLFVTCLGEQFFSPMLRDLVTVLERLGVECAFPEEQTCCGQPFFNSGFQAQARDLARKWIEVFDLTDGYIVSPSGSCVDMVREYYPELFPEGSAERERAERVAARTFEFTQFLVDELRVIDVGAVYPHRVTYHASCHLLRGLGARTEAKQLLQAVRSLEFVPLTDEETCCGFGGSFSVIYPEVSKAMMENKVRNIEASGAEMVVACDAGCLMNIAGGLTKHNSPVRALHIAQILARGEHE
ncbi:MAG: (Fe-S)-binding protein [Anaerolineae bacterium]